jgi:hypothetical protein
LPIDDARCQTLDRRTRKRGDRPSAVERLPEGVHHTSQERVSDRHGQDASSPPYGIAFLDVLARAEQDDPDTVLLEIEGQTVQSTWKLEHFARHGTGHAADPRDAVSDRNPRPHFRAIARHDVAADLLADHAGDIVSMDRSSLCVHSSTFFTYSILTSRSQDVCAVLHNMFPARAYEETPGLFSTP